MAKTISFEYKDTKYTLEYTRDTIVKMEDWGFDLEEFRKKPVTQVTLLVRGAFYTHHSATKHSLIDEIYDHIPHKDEFISNLIDMYNDSASSLTLEPDEDSEGNVKWVLSK